MNVGALLLLLGQYPEAIDHLQAEPVRPNVMLLLDNSTSMRADKTRTNCTYYADRFGVDATKMNRMDQMKAVLIGCTSAQDSFIWDWAGLVNFATIRFGRGVWVDSPFGATTEELIQSLTELEWQRTSAGRTDREKYLFEKYGRGGQTNHAPALRLAGEYMSDTLTPATTNACSPSYILMLSDGAPTNGGNGTFTSACDGGPAVKGNLGQPWYGAAYLYKDNNDLLCNLPGNQKITTHTIAFGKPNANTARTMQLIASEGGGQYFTLPTRRS